MGKTLARLATARLPRQTIFGERFVVECCERFHLHYKNLRVEIAHEDFLRIADAAQEMVATYAAHGSPVRHPHLELCRARLDPENTPSELSIELCENLYRSYATGWDSRFHREDSFVHIHWRDLRLEMANAEFLELGRAFRDASARLRAWKLKSLSETFRLLDEEGIVYAVMRNWENLPDGVEVGPHSDLDLLVHPDHVSRFDRLLDARPTIDDPRRVQRRIDVMAPDGPSFVLTDVRSPGDGYFPDELAHRMLGRRVRHREFWVLHPEDHLLGLAYHMVHHKGFATGDYWQKMHWLAGFTRFGPPTDADGMAYAVGVLADAGIERVEPDDPSVCPVLPLLEPVERMLTSRYLGVAGDVVVFSRVSLAGDDGDRAILKQTAGDFARHEYEILQLLDAPFFPRVRGACWQSPGHASFLEDHIDGVKLSEAAGVVRDWSFDEARDFTIRCLEMLAYLEEVGVAHRDLRAENLFIRHGEPVLIDFGWAVAPGHPMPEPPSGFLGGEARVPEGEPCDAYSLGYVLATHVVEHFPELEAVTAPLLGCRTGSPPDWPTLVATAIGLEEDASGSRTERFVRLCELGRYREAREYMPVPGERLILDAAFWRWHLDDGSEADAADVGGAGTVESAPERALSDPGLAARIAREVLERRASRSSREAASDHGVDAADADPPPAWLGDLLQLHLDRPGRPPMSIVDVALEHHEVLTHLIDPGAFRDACDRAGRLDPWLRREALFELAHGSDTSRQRLVLQAVELKRRLNAETIAALAELSDAAGMPEHAVRLARLVIDQDPYVVSCARILAGAHERAGLLDEAAREWRRVATLDQADRAARDRARRLEWSARSAARHGAAAATPDTALPDDPGQLIQVIRAAIGAGQVSDAIAAARKLGDRHPEHAAQASAVLERLETLRAGEGARAIIRVAIDPLGDETYAADPDRIREQLSVLRRTPLGGHPEIEAEWRRLNPAPASAALGVGLDGSMTSG